MWKIKTRGMLSQKSNNSSSLGDLSRTREVVVVAGGGPILMAGVVVEAAVVWVVADTRMGVEAAVDTRVGVADTREVVMGTRMAGVVTTPMTMGTTSRGTSTTGAGAVGLVAILTTTTREEARREVAATLTLRGLRQTLSPV